MSYSSFKSWRHPLIKGMLFCFAQDSQVAVRDIKGLDAETAHLFGVGKTTLLLQPACLFERTL